MQSCSRSSLGRWSMELLRGNIERGFFFFSGSGEQLEKKTQDKPTNTNSCRWLLWHKPGFSLFFGAAKVFLWISGVVAARIHGKIGELLTLVASLRCFFCRFVTC